MAAGFKQATVNASDVPASQSNYPAYVDLSRVGITTLAEAQSVRCYSDSAKTTELAREIVSATEMHVKIPSLTSTFVLYVDYDGVRADYAVTDTYGRNAVWDDYTAVFHFESDATNSEGTSGYNGTATNVTYSGGAAQFVKAGGTGSTQRAASSYIYTTAPLASTGHVFIRFQNDLDPSTTVEPIAIGGTRIGVSDYLRVNLRFNTSDIYNAVVSDNSVQSSAKTINTADIYDVHTRWNTSAVWYSYWDGVKEITGGAIENPTYSGFALGFGCVMNGATYWNNNGANVYIFDGRIYEARISSVAPDENWAVTENHNWSDEPGFWGTWTDVAVGANFTSPSGGVAYTGGMTFY